MMERQNNTLQILVCLLLCNININLLLCIATHPPLPDPGTLHHITHAKTHDYETKIFLKISPYLHISLRSFCRYHHYKKIKETKQ